MITVDDLNLGAIEDRCVTLERRERRQAFQPIQRLATSAWADRYLWLSPEDTGEKVKYSSALTPYHRAIMDALGDIRVRRVVAMLASQLGKTTIMKADLGSRIHQRPSPVLWAIPRDKDVRIWSKERVDTLIRDTPVLRGLVSDETRDKRNTIARKGFPGGYLGIVGMTQPNDLSARPMPIVRVDELDRAPREAGNQGAGLGLLRRRMTRFAYRSLGLFSTPTVKGDSPIEDEYESSSQGEWYVPCPRCGAYQVLKWGGPDVRWGLKWQDGDPQTAHYVCEECEQPFGEDAKRTMNAAGEWRHRFPERTTDLGFHANALISPFDGARWSTLIKDEFLRASGNVLELKQFKNTILAETWEDRTSRLEVGDLVDRLETYEAQVPHGVAVLTRGVDTQDDRLEMGVWGYGADGEKWVIDYEYIPGDPGTPVPWRKLDEIRATRRYLHASGQLLRPIATLVDALGHHTSSVHAWAKQHARDPEPAYAISGDGREGHPILGKPTWHKHARITTYRVGTWDAKYALLTSLHGIDQPGPGYIHLPQADWFDAERLRQLAFSERLVEKTVKGRLQKFWEVRGRNEFLDIAVYCLAGVYLLGLRTVHEGLGAMAAQVSQAAPPSAGAGSAPVPRPTGRRMRSPGVRVT